MLEDKEKRMAIGSAVQRGNSVNVYNERGVMLFSKVGELIGQSFEGGVNGAGKFSGKVFGR